MNITPRSRKTVKGNSRGKRGLGFLPPSLLLGIAIGVLGCGLLFFSSGFNRWLPSNEVDLEREITVLRGSHANGNDKNFVTKDTSKKLNLSKVGFEGGAWTAETHLSEYGFNVDWGLLEVLESSCREIESSRIPDGENKWEQYTHSNHLHPLNGWWKPPSSKYINCKVLEIGCGVGVYADAFKKEHAKHKRKVIGIEPNPMGGTFNRGSAGPKQLAINLLAADDQAILARKIRNEELDGEGFDLIYSIEVMEHMPLDRHDDAVKFLAAAARKGTKLIFGAATPGQHGVGHIGCRKQSEWVEIMAKHNFIKHNEETGQATGAMQEYNHRVNTVVYYYQGDEV
uniref:Methyltransferase type 11 domain-containing protein n=1 Tax=Chaetoceros debilis TaxID=122233 RepID=A0A7S3QK54_9STRA